MKKYFLIVLLAVGGVLLIIWIGSWSITRWYLEPVMEKKLKSLVSERSLQRYQLDMETIETSMWNRSITVENMVL